MADLFISYARADRSRVAPLVAALEAEGFSVWWDPEIIPGQEFDRLIAEELDKAWAVIVVWTPISVQSVWVRGEAREGRERGVLAPARFDNARLPIDMRAIHATDLDGWNEDPKNREFRQLVRAVRALEPGRGESSPSGGAAEALHLRAPARNRAPRISRHPIVWAAAAALLVAAGGAFIFVQSLADKGPPAIAVMPFHTASGDALERGFAQGVAAQVADGLTKAGLKVVSHGARFVVDGLATRSADHRLVVDARLDDTRNGGLLWSAKFDRPEAQSQTMQEQVAAKIVGVAHCALDANGFNGGRTDDETLGLYLKACDLWNEPEGKAELRSLLQQIVQRQPRFAKGWAKLAQFNITSNQDDDALNSPDLAARLRRDAEEAVRRAQQLDPKEPLVYATLYDLRPSNGDFRQREAILAKGLAFNPDSPDLLGREAELLAQVGRMDEAANAARRAMELDPLTPSRTEAAAQFTAFDGDLSSARALADRAQRLWPDLPDVWWMRLGIETREGDTRLALKMLDGPPGPPAGPKNNPHWLNHWRDLILARQTHDPARIAAIVADREYSATHWEPAIGFDILDLETIGATDAAFTILAAKRDLSDFPLDQLFRPEGDTMLRDARFMPLAARLGLVDYWRSSGHWPDFCFDPRHPFDCKAAAAALPHPTVKAL